MSGILRKYIADADPVGFGSGKGCCRRCADEDHPGKRQSQLSFHGCILLTASHGRSVGACFAGIELGHASMVIEICSRCIAEGVLADRKTFIKISASFAVYAR